MGFLLSIYGKQPSTFEVFTMRKLNTIYRVWLRGINGVDNKRRLKYYFEKKAGTMSKEIGAPENRITRYLKYPSLTPRTKLSHPVLDTDHRPAVLMLNTFNMACQWLFATVHVVSVNNGPPCFFHFPNAQVA